MSILNWDKDFALEQAADDQELLKELLDIFKISFKEDIEKIKEGAAVADFEKVSSAAHSIKGASSSLGITGITELAKEIEERSKTGEQANMPSLVGKLEKMLVEVEQL